NVRALLNMSFYRWLQGLTAHVRHYHSSYFAVTLQQAHHGNFASATSAFMFPLVGVTITRQTADKSLVNFNVSRKFAKRSVLHGLADAVKQKPRGLLGDSQSAVNLVRTNAVLRVGDQPDSG